jgi:hypothetical protein
VDADAEPSGDVPVRLFAPMLALLVGLAAIGLGVVLMVVV